MITILRHPPIPPLEVDTLDDFPPSPDDVLALLPDGSHRYPDRKNATWKTIDPPPKPELVRPPDMPVLMEGHRFGDWVARYGPDSVRKVELPSHYVHFLAKAETLVRKDYECLMLEDAIHVAADLQMLCTQVHYTIDHHADEKPNEVVVYDAPSHSFYLLTGSFAPTNLVGA